MADRSGTTDIVTSRRNSLVTRCRMLARSGGTTTADVLLDGSHLVQEAVRAGVAIELAAMVRDASPEPDQAPEWLAPLSRAQVHIVRVTASVLAALSPSGDSQVVAIARRPSTSLATGLDRPRRAILVIADVQDPGNVGALVRVAHAAGFDAVVATGATADPWSWKALRGSMGSAFHLPVLVERDTNSALAAIRANGMRVLATAPRGGRPLDDVDVVPPLALVVGGEGAGLPDPIIEAADATLTLPMAPGVESLNVAVAAGILAYEVRRRRLS